MSKKTVNAKNLSALGTERLTALVLDLCEQDKEAKRRVRLELTHAAGPGALVQEVRKRLITIGRSRGTVYWDKCKAYTKDVKTQITMIRDRILPDAPEEAFELAWQFLTISPSIEERLEDRHVEVDNCAHDARQILSDAAPRASLDPETLADRVFEVISGETTHQWSDLIAHLGPALGKPGCARLSEHIKTYEGKSMPKDPSMQDRAIRLPGGRVGYVLGANRPAERKARKVKQWRQQIADVQGDVDGFLAQHSAEDLKDPFTAADIANRLIEADRAGEAADLLEASLKGLPPGYYRENWNEAYIKALSILGRKQDLHAYRWSMFQTFLSVPHLRDLLKAMPDFEDIEQEDAAKAHAAACPILESALAFFLEWPDREKAAALILERAEELDGNDYEVLTRAATDLEAEHPLAAVLCLRAMIGWTLEHQRTARYGHAVRHLATCTRMDIAVSGYDGYPEHDDFVRELRKAHGRKSSFWSKVE